METLSYLKDGRAPTGESLAVRVENPYQCIACEGASLARSFALEFEHEGTAHRGKLSWISPFSGRWLMVPPKGRKVADLDARDVARQLPDQSLVRRALATQLQAPPAPSTSRRRTP